jgi:hypothetical protein
MLNRSAVGQVPSVTLGTDTVLGSAGQHGLRISTFVTSGIFDFLGVVLI